jgi:hypothetical protein
MKRTAKVFAALLAGYLVLASTAYWAPELIAQASVWLVMVPLFSIYGFHALGIPGLLEHGGRCGWGWCSPTSLGWAFLAAFWLGLFWAAAWAIARFPRKGEG